MRLTALSFVSAVAVLAAPPAFGQETYSYAGNPFEFADSPWTTSDRVTGSFVVPDALGPWFSGNLSAVVQTFGFTDGVNTRTLADSTPCVFSVETGGAGEIVAWTIALRQAPTPPNGTQTSTLDTTGSVDLAALFTSDGTPCPTVAVFDAIAQTTLDPGVWTTTATLTPDPAEYVYTGQPFTTLNAPNSAGDRVTGRFAVSGPLPPVFGTRDIASAVTDFSFTDGVDTFDAANGILCQFQVETGPWGLIRDWVAVVGLDADPALAATQRVLYLSASGDRVETGENAGPCGVFLTTGESSVPEPGDWLSDRYPPLNPARYEYRGEPYDSASGGGTVGDITTGYVVFARPLPSNMPPTALAPYILDFGFADALQTRTPTDSETCEFTLATDGVGDIDAWDLLLREAPKPPTGDPQESLDIRSASGNISAIGIAGNTTCAGIALVEEQSTAVPGTWRGPVAPASIPTLGRVGLALLAGLLLVLAAMFPRIRAVRVTDTRRA